MAKYIAGIQQKYTQVWGYGRRTHRCGGAAKQHTGVARVMELI